MAGLKPTAFDARLGARLKAAREDANVTQAELAGVIGVSAAQLQKYEGGVNRISAGLLQKAAHRFGLEPGVFFDPREAEGGTADGGDVAGALSGAREGADALEAAA